MRLSEESVGALLGGQAIIAELLLQSVSGTQLIGAQRDSLHTLASSKTNRAVAGMFVPCVQM